MKKYVTITACIDEFKKIKTIIENIKIQEEDFGDRPEYEIQTQEQNEETTY